MNRKEKKVFMVNAKTTTLAEMDYINQQHNNRIFQLTPAVTRKIREYISSFLPVNQYYEIAFGEIKEYQHKVGDSVIAKDWDILYIGELKSRGVDTSKVFIDYDCKYQLKSGSWKRVKESGRIETLTNYLESYSMEKLKSLTENGTPKR